MYIKEKELHKTNNNCSFQRLSNNSFLEHNEKLKVNCLISYHSKIGLVYNNILFLDDRYYDFSKTTNDLIYNYYTIIRISNLKDFDFLFELYRQNNENIYHYFYYFSLLYSVNKTIIKTIKENKPKNIKELLKLLNRFEFIKNNIDISFDYPYNKTKELKTVTQQKTIIKINNCIKLLYTVNVHKKTKKITKEHLKILYYNNNRTLNINVKI